MRTLIGMISILLCCTQALAVDFRWTVGFGQGTFEAIIRNADDSSVNIYCPQGQSDTTPGMFIDSKRIRPSVGEQIAVQIIVDGKNYPFYLDEDQFEARGRANMQSLHSLIDALVKSTGQHFVVEYPKFGTSEQFSLLGTEEAFKSANDFLDGCE